ncbi:MAG: SUKH-3 domain-containing protein [Prevotella sp.]|nr:SUKH-3 domain-containing protein [Prevotella sp.]
MEITGRALHFLRKYGWSEERNVDISEYVKQLEKNGYEVFDCVKDFLRSFGGLYLMPSTNWSEVYKKENKDGAGYDLRSCYVHFDVLSVQEAYFESSYCERYEARIGEKLVPIGETEKGYISLMMSETGRVFGIYEGYMGLYGNNYVEALETIYWNREPKEIPGVKEIEDAIQWDANRDHICNNIECKLTKIMKKKMRIKKNGQIRFFPYAVYETNIIEITIYFINEALLEKCKKKGIIEKTKKVATKLLNKSKLLKKKKYFDIYHDEIEVILELSEDGKRLSNYR